MKEDICKTCGGIHCDDCGINQPLASQSELIAALGGKPTEAGEYEIWCEECEEWTPITITAEPWGLLAHCPDTGGHPLDVYHDALTAVMWRKAP